MRLFDPKFAVADTPGNIAPSLPGMTRVALVVTGDAGIVV